jgi:hypothetical protein
MTKEIWSDYYCGLIEVTMVATIKQLPKRARYKYTDDDNLSIYECNDCFYGVVL